ncbi:MAG: hypothetical protein V1701_09755, partial [Planctomycetota bacterium]
DEAKKVLGARTREERNVDYFGMAGGYLMATTTNMTGQSLATGLRNYAVSYGMPKLFKAFGANETWQNIGGGIASGVIIGGMESVNTGKFKDWVNPMKWQPAAMLQTGLVFGTTAAIQHVGYKNKWDSKLFGGASMFASKIGGVLAESALSYAVGGWGLRSISSDLSKPVWLSRTDYWKAVGSEGKPISVDGFASAITVKAIDPISKEAFTGKWLPLVGEGISLGVQHFAEKQFGWERHPEYSRGVGSMVSFAAASPFSDKPFSVSAIGEMVLTAAAKGVASAALQHVTKELTPLGPYAGAVGSMILSNAIYSSLAVISPDSESQSRLDLSKDLFNTNCRVAIGDYLSGGIAVLNRAGDLNYHSPFDASFAANMIDFGRQARDLPNSTWTQAQWKTYNTTGQTPNAGKSDFRVLASTLNNRYFNNLHNQAVDNLTRTVSNLITGVQNDKLNGRWGEVRLTELDKTMSYNVGTVGHFDRFVGEAQQWTSLDRMEKQMLKVFLDKSKSTVSTWQHASGEKIAENSLKAVPADAMDPRELRDIEIQFDRKTLTHLLIGRTGGMWDYRPDMGNVKISPINAEADKSKQWLENQKFGVEVNAWMERGQGDNVYFSTMALGNWKDRAGIHAAGERLPGGQIAARLDGGMRVGPAAVIMETGRLWGSTDKSRPIIINNHKYLNLSGNRLENGLVSMTDHMGYLAKGSMLKDIGHGMTLTDTGVNMALTDKDRVLKGKSPNMRIDAEYWEFNSAAKPDDIQVSASRLEQVPLAEVNGRTIVQAVPHDLQKNATIAEVYVLGDAVSQDVPVTTIQKLKTFDAAGKPLSTVSQDNLFAYIKDNNFYISATQADFGLPQGSWQKEKGDKNSPWSTSRWSARLLTGSDGSVKGFSTIGLDPRASELNKGHYQYQANARLLAEFKVDVQRNTLGHLAIDKDNNAAMTLSPTWQSAGAYNWLSGEAKFYGERWRPEPGHRTGLIYFKAYTDPKTNKMFASPVGGANNFATQQFIKGWSWSASGSSTQKLTRDELFKKLSAALASELKQAREAAKKMGREFSEQDWQSFKIKAINKAMVSPAAAARLAKGEVEEAAADIFGEFSKDNPNLPKDSISQSMRVSARGKVRDDFYSWVAPKDSIYGVGVDLTPGISIGGIKASTSFAQDGVELGH